MLRTVNAKLYEHGYTSLRSLPVDPFAICQREGIHVAQMPLGGRHALLWPGENLTSIILAADEPRRWPYSLAHELIHHWCHPRQAFWYGTSLEGAYERQAEWGAARLLMPEWAVREVGASLDWDVQRLAHAFGVSRAAMRIRLEELGIRPAA